MIPRRSRGRFYASPYQAEEDLVMRNAGDPDDAQDGMTRNGKGATDVCSISFKGGKPPREGE
jgi:hypothetical protein